MMDGKSAYFADHCSLRLALFHIGAVILRNARRVRFLLASGCPYQDLFCRVAQRHLAPD